MDPEQVIWFRYYAVSMLVVGGLVTSVSWLSTRARHDPVGPWWFSAIAMQLLAGSMYLFVGTPLGEVSAFAGSSLSSGALYLLIHGLELSLSKNFASRRWMVVQMAHLGLFWLLYIGLGLSTWAYVFTVAACTAAEICAVRLATRLKKQRSIRSATFIQVAFGAAAISNAYRLYLFAATGTLVRVADFSIRSMAGLSLLSAAIILMCLFYIGYAIEQSEARQHAAQLEADRLTLAKQVAEKHAAEMEQLVAQRDNMMMLNSRFFMLGTMQVLGGGALHEMSQPLQAVGSAVDVLIDEVGDKDKALATRAREISTLVDRITAILDHFRKLLRTGSPQLEALNIKAHADHAFRIVQSEARLRGIEASLAVEVAANDARVLSNPILFERVMLNLCANAIEAICEAEEGVPRKLRIEIGVVDQKQGRQLAIHIHNTGKRLSAAKYKAMFDPFHSSKPNGLGLGLNIVKAFVEGWNGEIRATAGLTDAYATTIEILLPMSVD